MKKLFWLNLALILFTLQTPGQTKVNDDLRFVEHLTNTGKNREAIDVLNNQPELTQTDTGAYLKAINYYLLKRLDSAAKAFSIVQPQSPLFVRSVCFEALHRSFAGNYQQALTTLQKLPPDSIASHQQLINTSRAGNYLLLRDYKKFDSISKTFSSQDYRINPSQEQLLKSAADVKKQKRKSPLVAGCLSAVVPGLGKFYAGKRGAGLAAFASCTALALVTGESYYRSRSFKNPAFITFGTIFVFFYTGNIYGSVFSVKQSIRSTNGRINNEILASIHIPLVRLFR